MKLIALAAALLTLVLLGGVVIYQLVDDEDLGERAEEIAEDPEELLGERVTITGQVESFFPGAFTVGASTWGEELLVVPAEGVRLPRVIQMRAATPDVSVTGVVERKGDQVELVGGEEFEPYEGEAIVRASEIRILE